MAQNEVIQKTSGFADMISVLNSVTTGLDAMQNCIGNGNNASEAHQNLLEPTLMEFRQKVADFSDMAMSLRESQVSKDDVKGLIRDVRSFVEHIITQEQKSKQNSLLEQGQDLPAPATQRRKARSRSQKLEKRKATTGSVAGPSLMRRFRKKAKMNYSEHTDLDEEEPEVQ